MTASKMEDWFLAAQNNDEDFIQNNFKKYS